MSRDRVELVTTRSGEEGSDFCASRVPNVDWADDLRPDYCPDCVTSSEAVLRLAALGGLIQHLAALPNPTIPSGVPTPTADIDALIDARRGDGDPR